MFSSHINLKDRKGLEINKEKHVGVPTTNGAWVLFVVAVHYLKLAQLGDIIAMQIMPKPVFEGIVNGK